MRGEGKGKGRFSNPRPGKQREGYTARPTSPTKGGENKGVGHGENKRTGMSKLYMEKEER